MHRTPEYYTAIEKRIMALSIKRDEYLEISQREREYQALDYMMNHDAPWWEPAEDVATRYQEYADELTKVIDDLKTKLPCREFIQRFGFWLHEEYRERYPINHETQFRIMPYNGGSVYYVVFKPVSIFEFSANPSPIGPDIDRREARWERWRDQSPDAQIVALAYNKDENIVYIGG